MAKYYAAPQVGDIVQCRFPQDRIRQPGPKERPALVIEVEEFELPDQSIEVFVTVAYGTSVDVEHCHPGEIRINSTDPHAGLGLDTKFDLGCRVKLPFDMDWFAPAPGKRFGAHPKRGKLNTANSDLKRRLSSAIAELKKERRPATLDMSSKSGRGKNAKP